MKERPEFPELAYRFPARISGSHNSVGLLDNKRCYWLTLIAIRTTEQYGHAHTIAIHYER